MNIVEALKRVKNDIANWTVEMLFSKMDKENPTGTGSFSLNRKDGSVVGECSFAEGQNTIASSTNQHVQGSYNIEDATGEYAHIVGNGTDEGARSNAYTLDWDGNAWFAGDVYIGGTGQNDETATKLATVADIETAIGTAIGGSY